LAVRSSANGEDLEQLAGAGLYDSVIGVRAGEGADAIRKVWASIWTRRATLSRIQAGIPHDRIHMAVLVQALVEPELSFVMHTLDPATKDPEIADVELAIGLGETLASASQPGTPYRLRCNRTTGETSLANCAGFSYALRPGSGGALARERLDYSNGAVAALTAGFQSLGARLAAVASMLQERLDCPQDVEGMLTSDDRLYIVQTRPQQGI
jgi:phosphoglucan, water dikinase